MYARVILGYGCNCRCVYCYQDHRVTHWELNPKIYDVLTADYITNVMFFGGEPLLYLDEIEEICKHLPKTTRREMLSNGKALTKDIVEFLNKYNINYGVSWDGTKGNNLRGYDFFADEEKTELFLTTNKNYVRTIFTENFFPFDALTTLQKINQRKFEKTGNHLHVSYAWKRCYTPEEFTINESELYKSTNKVIDEALKTDDVYNLFRAHVNRYMWYFRKPHFIDFCNEFQIVLDIKGNVYRCHCSEDIAGHIGSTTIDTVAPQELLDKRKNECENCKYLALCGAKCPYAHHMMCDAYRIIGNVLDDRKTELLEKFGNNSKYWDTYRNNQIYQW